MPENNVRSYRERQMMSKAELARKAGLSTLTIDRVEAGRPCRLDTKRKVLLALGLKVSDKDLVFRSGAESEPTPSSVAAGSEPAAVVPTPAANGPSSSATSASLPSAVGAHSPSAARAHSA